MITKTTKISIMINFATILILIVVAELFIIDKLIGMYAVNKYKEWKKECNKKIKEQKGAEACYENCPPEHYYMVFRFSSEYNYPFPEWTRYFRTYGNTVYSSQSMVMHGPLIYIPSP